MRKNEIQTVKARACAVMHAPSLYFYGKRAPRDPESKEAFLPDPGNRDALQSDHNFQEHIGVPAATCASRQRLPLRT